MKTFASLLMILVLAALAQAGDVAVLTKQLKDKDTDVRRQAAKELSAMGAEARTAVPALVAALKDEDLFVRRFAAQALGEIGPDARTALKPLTEALRDPKKEVIEAAALALGKFGEPAAQPLGALVADKNRPSLARRRAVEALGHMGKDAKAAVPALTAALKDREIRLEAAQALGKIGPDAKEALKELEAIAASRERDRAFRQAVTQAIRQIKK